MWLVALAAVATEDECRNGHVRHIATDVYLKPLGSNDGVTAIRQAEFNAQGNNLDDYLDKYVTVTDDDGNLWPDSTYLIANGMVLKRSSVVGLADPDWYYVHYSSYPDNYADNATNITIGAMVAHGQPTLVTLTSWSAGCAPEAPPSPAHPPSPPPGPPTSPPPPLPPASPPSPPPHDGYWEFWMTPLFFGLFGPLLAVCVLVIAVSTCDIFQFEPRVSDAREVRERFARERNNGVVLRADPGPNQYTFELTESLRRATEPASTSKQVTWR